MTTDWTAIGRDYAAGGGTYAALAAKYGVSTAAVAHHGAREGWKARRLAHRRQQGTEAADTSAVDGGALRFKLLALADNWTDEQGGHIEDVGDYRRMVQSVLDLTRAEGDAAPAELRVVMDVPAEYGE